MFKIDGTTITMVRGDTFSAFLKIYSKNKILYSPTAEDTIVFAVKESYTDDQCVLTKSIPYDTMILELEPNDTKSLDQPSSYVYEISLTMEDGTVDTFIRGKLIIEEEIL